MRLITGLLLLFSLACNGQTATPDLQGTLRLGAGLVSTPGGPVSVTLNGALGTLPDARLTPTILTKAATIQATTYANALTQIATLGAGVSALVKVAADESPGNVGTGANGTNPTTYYLFFPVIGLVQQVVYPN